MGGKYSGVECVSPEKLVTDIPYVIMTLDYEDAAESVCEQCNKMRVQARSYKELVRERSYVTNWNQIDYPMLLMSCAIRGQDVGEELSKLKKSSGKKILMFYGNCQTGILSDMALSSKKISEKFFVMCIPPVQNLSINERESGIHQGVLDNLDVLFYQHVNFSNSYSRKLGSGTVTQGMNRESQVKICIPNVFYSGYFPQMKESRYQPTGVGGYAVGAGPFPGDANIEKMWDEFSNEEIVKKLSDENFYDADTVIETAQSSIEELKNREEVCDVIISDYIQENFRKERLFFIPNHPKTKVIFKLLKRSFVKMGIDVDDVNLESIGELDVQVIPIYPSVKKALNLNFFDDICYEPSLKEKPSNLSQYIDGYIKYCKPLWKREQESKVFSVRL